jgi:hypothetical protein
MEVVHTYEGTDSIQALIVGRDVPGISAFAQALLQVELPNPDASQESVPFGRSEVVGG